MFFRPLSNNDNNSNRTFSDEVRDIIGKAIGAPKVKKDITGDYSQHSAAVKREIIKAAWRYDIFGDTFRYDNSINPGTEIDVASLRILEGYNSKYDVLFNVLPRTPGIAAPYARETTEKTTMVNIRMSDLGIVLMTDMATKIMSQMAQSIMDEVAFSDDRYRDYDFAEFHQVDKIFEHTHFVDVDGEDEPKPVKVLLDCTVQRQKQAGFDFSTMDAVINSMSVEHPLFKRPKVVTVTPRIIAKGYVSGLVKEDPLVRDQEMHKQVVIAVRHSMHHLQCRLKDWGYHNYTA